MSANDERYLQAIWGRMRCMGAADTSDAEIERCLSGCVSPSKLIKIAKRLRDCSLLRLDMNDGVS